VNWKKLGIILAPDGSLNWMHSHAAVPFVITDSTGRDFLYFSTRDENNKSHVGRASLTSSLSVAFVDPDPVLSPGGFGFFDEDGVTASYGFQEPDHIKLYYVGWNKGTNVPFRNALGLATSYDNGLTFKPISTGPILDRSPVDPCFVAGACVMKESDGYRMWYISCVRWERGKDGPKHYYHLKYATSVDGIDWKRDGTVVIDFKSDYEYAISQPWVIRDQDGYKMWFSYRGQSEVASYRIGYAESKDGIVWQRNDSSSGIDVSDQGWDSEMVCYPYVFRRNDQTYMLYNGNNYGETGIGLAVLEN
jgi:hypothetical protein